MRTSRNAIFALAVLAAAAPLALSGCRGEGPAAPPAAAPRYHCPMHPTYVLDRPGDCPICGMKLVPIEAPRQAAPGEPEAHLATPPGESGVAGRAVVTLAPDLRQMLGVRSEPVRRSRLEHVIRTVGRVAADERRLHHVHTKFEAYVEHLHVDFTGQFVKQGEPLLSLYSPELVATQQEYLLAYRAQQQLAGSSIPSVAKGGVDLLEAARQRLLSWDIKPEDIEHLRTTGEVRRTLDLHSDVNGYVVQKNVVHGMRVMPQDTLFDIADLSQLWVLADVYETDLPAVRLGMEAQLHVTYLPGREWRGPVTWVSPTVEEQTRTVKVRIEVANPDERLKPGMFADVFLESDLGEGLVLPASAVIDTGDRRLVFLDHGEGRYEPREVQLGVRVNEGVQLLRGAEEGDRVVVSAGFLLDSESSLEAAISAMGAAPPAAQPEHRH
jgi:Cu(I)/Ag(I) efflux system membrane fusion protein